MKNLERKIDDLFKCFVWANIKSWAQNLRKVNWIKQKLLSARSRSCQHVFKNKVLPGLSTELSHSRTFLLRYHIPSTRIYVSDRNVVGIGSQVSAPIHKRSASLRGRKFTVGLVRVLRSYVVSYRAELLHFIGAWSWEFFQMVQWVVGESWLERYVGFLKGGLNWVIAGAGDVMFKHWFA